MKYYVLYNPKSGSGTGEEETKRIEDLLKEHEIIYKSVLEIEDFKDFLTGIPVQDRIVIAGGDGTLNRFADSIKDVRLRHQIDYFAVGSGNDFIRDLGKKKLEYAADINKYLTDLPVVKVNGIQSVFINAIGYGIDGYCCEEADKKREKSDKKINYSLIAIKGLLGGFKPNNARVTVDGRTYRFKKVWLAPTMNGRYFGGGIMAGPRQDRLNPERTVSVICMHSIGRIRCLARFSSLFTGEHTKYKDMCNVYEGHSITVEFEKPCALQIDGETVLDVTSYSVESGIKNELEMS